MKQIVLFVGAPGIGKSTLGTYLAKKHKTTCRFFSAGEWIRENKLNTLPDEELRSAADIQLKAVLDSGDDRLILLEFVKDIDNAFRMLDVVRSANATLVQVVWITEETDSTIRKMAANMADSPSHRSMDRYTRLPKWHNNVGRIIEVVSSMGVLCLLTSTKNRTRQSTFIVDDTRSCNPLAGILPKRLKLVPLSWVVSPQLIVDKSVSEHIIDEATRRIAGLKQLQLLMPSASVHTEEDVEWVLSPGRYSISHKCDGTRYLLIVLSNGQVFFKNRVDFIYSYPIESALPSQTILDGELIWETQTERGVFLVFDALVVNGERVWMRPLEKRLEILQSVIRMETDEELTPSPFSTGMHRQRAPTANARIRILFKRHFDTLKDAGTPTFPSDGLIFTAKAMPYVLPVLTRKWHPWEKRAVDLRGAYDLIYECVHDQNEWRPETIRWDKTRESDCHEQIYRVSQETSLLYGPVLKQLVLMQPSICTLPMNRPLFRPIMSKADCMLAVQASKVERTLDANTGLEIFNRRKNGAEIPCRGIIFDGDQPIAAAFETFADGQPQDTTDSCWSSLKLDGTLIIAFKYHDQVHTATRRRMDSEQAIWAKQWLCANANLHQFEDGWTYAFEAIYENNTVIVPYAFEALVFLDAWSPDGMSLSPTKRLEQAERLSVMCAPSIYCRVQDRRQLLNPVEAIPSYEGWILQCAETRWKLVQDAYKKASNKASIELHPLWVWNRVRMGEQPNANISHLPVHLKKERSKMLKAMEKAFMEEYNDMHARLVVEFDAERTWDLLCDLPFETNFVEFAFTISSESWIPSHLQSECICWNKPMDESITLKDTALHDMLEPISMYYNTFENYGMLRLELMDRIRPEDNGKLRHYSPSDNLMQTFYKGWTRSAPPDLVQDRSLISFILGDTDTLSLILNKAPVRAILVCKAWYKLITQDKENFTKKRLETESNSRSSTYQYDSGDSTPRHFQFGGFGNYDVDRDGYGSF